MRATVVIPTRDRPDLVAMAHATLEMCGVGDMEAILVDNGTRDPDARAALERSPHHVLRADIPFNFPRLVNRGAHHAKGDVLVLLNNDVEARDDGWLMALLEPLADPDVGVVGSILRYPSGRIQHAGIDLSDGAPRHVYAGSTWEAVPASVRSEVTEPRAVTGACMAVRADLWRSLHGMSTPLVTNYNDVDLCLRARNSGARVACVPLRGLIHHESESRGTKPTVEIAADWLLFRSRWADLLRSS